VVVAALAVLVVGVGIVAAGTPSRGVIETDAAEVLDRVAADIDPATFPPMTVDQDVIDWSHELAGPGAQQIILTLAENLDIESQALRRADDSLLTAVAHGDRLEELRARIVDATTSGRIVVPRYAFDSLHMTLRQPFGVQTGLSLGIEGQGTVTEEVYDAAGTLLEERTAPFDQTFVLRRATGGRWLNVAVLEGTGE
jgi:hypothetical protein